ncbi:MAG: DUF1737 domain-containing protein [Pseudomonadota bacterium]
MKRYRFITGKDDSEFCKRVETALNEGWELHGSPSLSFDSANGHGICGQAVTRTDMPERDEPLTL